MLSYIKKYDYHLRYVFLVLLFTGLAVSYVCASDTCVDCHKNEKFRVQNKVLFDYYNDWQDSSHQLAGISCVDCHGGDLTKKDKERSHSNNFSSLTSVDIASFKIIPERCGECHDEVLKNFIGSKHYKALMNRGTGPHCSTCHGSMNAEVYYTPIISRACKECHNEYTKNNPEVVGEADKILHRINVSRVFRNWVSIHYAEKDPQKVQEMNALYMEVANSWHEFDFALLDQKSKNLLNQLKSLVNRRLSEKRKK